MTDAFIAEMETRFRDGMSALYGTSIPLYYSNAPVPQTVDTFAVIHVIASDRTIPISFGKEAKRRNVGVIQIDVYTPKDTGAGDGRRIANAAGKLFDRETIQVASEGLATMEDYTVMDRGEVRGRHKEQCDIGYRYDFVI